MKTSLMAGVTAEAKVYESDWEDFCSMIRRFSVPRVDESDEEKRNSPSFSCCEYYPPRRGLANIRDSRLWGIVLDFDQIRDPDRLRGVFDKYRYIAWTTWRSEADRPRWRFVLPVQNGLGVPELKGAVDAIAHRVGDAARVDRCSSDAAHLWFMPWHRASAKNSHRVWTNEGDLFTVPRVIRVDFTGIPSNRPEGVDEGERNVALYRYLGSIECLRSKTYSVLLEFARKWNKGYSRPLTDSEVRSTAKKKWAWMTTAADGLKARAGAMDSQVDEIDVSGILQPLSFDAMLRVQPPEPLVGNFLFPGVTLVTAKMKEGKSFLAAQLSVALASGEPFLASPDFPGYSVSEKQRVVLVAGEDTPWLIAQRYGHNMAAGHFPKVDAGMISVVYAEQLQDLRNKTPKAIPGRVLLERLIDDWYRQGFRVICLDPLRITEAMLGIGEGDYPGSEYSRNIHTRDLLTTAYFHRMAMKYDGLCILISLHHGKNKRDHDAADPGDMIAGTTGLGAGAGCTMAILPVPKPLAPDHGDDGPKRRELYVHGRVVRESRMLIEQDEKSGLWKCLGKINDTLTSEAQGRYFEALLRLGGREDWVTAERVAAACSGKEGTVQKVLSRAMKSGVRFRDYRLVCARSRGYKLVI